MKVAIVYDRVNKWGGAERTLLALHELFPDAPLFTSLYSPKKAPWAKVFPEIKTSFLQRIPFLRKHELIPFLMPLAFESFDFSSYDTVISVTSEAAKGIITKPGTYHICLCLTPTRYLWSGYTEYFKNSFFRFTTQLLVKYLRMWDTIAAQRPDIYMANSHEVQQRIRTYYGRNAGIIYPPVTEEWTGEEAPGIEKTYYLVVGRLSRFTKYKRIDLAIKACTRLKLPLKVVGAGDVTYFRKFAGPTIEFLGEVSDEKLHTLYLSAKALLFPGFEDFGMVMAEANLHGIPVIAYDKGGAQEIVIPGKTGELFSGQTVDSLCAAIEQSAGRQYKRNDCIKNAQRFSKETFEEKITELTLEREREIE